MLEDPHDGSAKTISDARNAPLLQDINFLGVKDQLKDSNQLSKSEAEKIITLFFDKMSEALARGDRVEIRGLCSFFVKKYKACTGRNPKTGEKVMIAPKKLPFFKAGKELKERVDG
jgi:integration host factor subunit beta